MSACALEPEDDSAVASSEEYSERAQAELGPELAERLEEHGLDPEAWSPPYRAPEPELAAPREDIDQATRERLETTWAGHTPLFVRARAKDAEHERVDSQAESPLLADATIDPMRMPLAALVEQTGLDLAFDLRVSKTSEAGDITVRESLMYRGRSPVVDSPKEPRRPSGQERVLAAKTELEQTHAPVRVDDDRLLVYATFTPQVRADAPMRVAWLAEQEDRGSAMKAAERERQVEIRERLARTRPRLEALGHCEFLYGTKANHAGYLACSPEGLRLLARDADFVEDIDIIEVGQPTDMRGDDLRADTGAQLARFTDDAAFQGDTATPGSGRSVVEVALLDGEGFYRAWNHPAFDDWANGPTRIDRVRACFGSGVCVNDTVSGTDGNKHGAISMVGAFSHLKQGQDPTVVSAQAREERSHGAYEAELELYRWFAGGGEPGLIEATDPNVDNGVDIAEISWSGGSCANVDGAAAWRDAWDFAYSHGTFGVISAGNAVNRTNDNCSANGWATRVDLLVVGGMGDNTAATPIAGWNYDTEAIMGQQFTNLAANPNCGGNGATCWNSSIGGANLRFSSVQVNPGRGVVDVVTPSGRALGAQMNGPLNALTQTYTTQCCGTSQAAPHAASAAVSLKDWANTNSFGVFSDPGFMHVNMLLMGDGSGAGFGLNQNPGAPTGLSLSGMNRLWGAGRLKMRLFNNAGLDGPGAWGTGALYVHHGDVTDIPIGGAPISSDVDAWTGAIAWDEPFLNANNGSNFAADIIFRVVTTNPVGGQCINPGGGSATTVRSDTSYDPQKRIHIRPGEISQLHGRCAWMRFQGLSVPNGADGQPRRLVYRADYWEDLDRESWENLDDIE